MILIINAGSATLKFSVFDKSMEEKLSGIVERIGLKNPFIICGKDKEVINYKIINHEQAFNLVLQKIKEKNIEIDLIGHRIVHGGEEFKEPTEINQQVLKKLEKYNKLAPLHNPVNLDCIKASKKIMPKIKDIAVFDTAFHSTMPSYAYLYAIPLEYYKKNDIRRYGFHGISHHYVCERAAKILKKPLSSLNLISCHLGSGCSITAVKKGKVVDTSMGFTPLEGLIMNTRSGDIDPALVIYMNKYLGLTPTKIDKLLNKNSGMFGLTGLKDMRDVMIAAGYNIKDYKSKNKISHEQKQNCKLALDMFVYRIVKYIGAYFLVLQNVDAIIFTAGIGERNADIRDLILKKIGQSDKFKSLVIPTNENLMIAKQIKKFI